MSKKDIQYIVDEYQVLKNLNSDNILKVYNLIKRQADYLLIMEYINGVTLDKYIRQEFSNLKEITQYVDIKEIESQLQQNFKFSDTFVQNGNIIYQNIIKEHIKQYHPEIYQCKSMYSSSYLNKLPIIIKQLINTLQYIHSKKIMHRDIKTENIMIQNDRIIFIDFGYAGKKEIQSTLVGTVGFQAPECSMVFQGQRHYDKKIDVWSLGQVMFELVAGYNKNIISHNLYLNTIQQNLGLSLPMTLFLKQEAINTLNNKTNYIEIIQSCLIVDPVMRASSDELVSMLQEIDQQNDSIQLKIVLLGKYNIGKTTLLRKLSKNYVKQDISQTSSTVKYVDNQNKAYNVHCTFLDTCGIENMPTSSLPTYLFRADICLLVYKLFDQESYEYLSYFENLYKRFNTEDLKNQIQAISLDWTDEDNKDEVIKYENYQTFYVNDETSKASLLNSILKNYFDSNPNKKEQLEKNYIGTVNNNKSCCK